MIDVAVERFGIEDATNGFLMIFSANPFPTANVQLDWERAEFAGNVYSWDAAQVEGWLCPAMNLYFERAPAKLFVEIKARSE